jgi:glucan phosphorylase
MACPFNEACPGFRISSAAYLSMEMQYRQFPPAYRKRNQRGGLGVLAGDIADELELLTDYIDARSFSPGYAYPWDESQGEGVTYKEFGWREHTTYVHYDGDVYPIEMLHLNKRRILAVNPTVFNVLYAEDRGMRLRQQVVFCKAVAQYLAETNTPVQAVWQNESHVAPIVPFLHEVYPDTRYLFTIHTQQDSGMERYYGDRFPVTGIRHDYRPFYVPWGDGVMDFPFASMAQANMVNGVSMEHGGITRQMFPQFRHKITSVTNGVSSAWWDPRLRSFDQSSCTHLDWLVYVHGEGRDRLDSIIEQETLMRPDAEKPLIGFIRRSQRYKNFPLVTNLLPVLCAKRGEQVDTVFGRVPGLGLQVAIASIAPESDNTCMGWMRNMAELSSQHFRGSFFFVNRYNYELLEVFARGLDCHIEAPEPGGEACGTSHMRTMAPTIASRTGGMLENITEVDRLSQTGTGWFVEPYDEHTLYQKAALFSDMWYAWREKRDTLYPRIMLNVLKKKSDIDIRKTLIEGYIPLVHRMVVA